MIRDTQKIANTIIGTINRDLDDNEKATINSLVERGFSKLSRSIIDNVIQEFSSTKEQATKKRRYNLFFSK